MTVDKQVLKSILRYDFWSDHKHQLVASLFSDELQELYEIIEKAHTKYKKDISTNELFALWKDENPVSTRAEADAIQSLIVDLDHYEEMSDEITSDIIDGLWKRELGRKIGNLGIAISEGHYDAFNKLTKLLEEVSDGFKPDDFGEPITNDILELLSLTGDSARWKFNINALSNRVYGLGSGDFLIVFARPETGKTAFAISLACGPAGWVEQGAKVVYLVNEEMARRTKLRAVMAYTGMSKDEILKAPLLAKEKFREIEDRFIIIDAHDWDTIKIEAFLDLHKPDIVIIDQLDKVSIDTDQEGHARLRELYIWYRTYIAKHNIAGVGLSQASVDAEGKTILTPNMMEGSKTGKYAEGDLILGIGKMPDKADGTPEVLRFITIGKNKLNGFHGTEICKIEPELSRYVD